LETIENNMEIMILKKEYEWVLKILNSSINVYQIKTSENLFNTIC